MSVLIKGMDMPTSCYACDFAYQDQDSEHNVYWTCAADHKAANMYERRSDCPLVEIHPHGRLIDADALMEVNAELADCDFIHPRIGSTLREVVEDAPTIVEAEGE